MIVSCLLIGRLGMRGRRRLSGDLDRRRQRHADGLEHGASATESGGAKTKPSAGLIDVGLNELIEIANDIGPFIATPIGGETVDEFLAQQQSKEGTEHGRESYHRSGERSGAY